MTYSIKYAALLWALFFMGASVCLASDQDFTANNVVIVLDASGSMAEKMTGSNVVKMQAAKTALKEVLSNVPADTQIGLLIFSSNNTTPWRFPLGPRDDAKIRSAIDAASPGGGTPLGEFISKAAQALAKQREKQLGYGTYRMLVVTDGQASDPQLMVKEVPLALRSGVRMDVIGVDMKEKHTLATKVHSYRRADDPQSLKKAVADVFAEVSGGAGTAATVDAFSELAPIPPETAGKMIRALSHQVELKNNPQPQRNASTAAPVNPHNNGSATHAVESGGGISIGYIIIMIFVGIIVFKVIAKK